jgi:hypothetical protein
MAVPYTFGSATSAIPLSQLDSNFATTITLGNTAIQLGNTVTTLNNMTLANVTISSVASAFPNNYLSNSTVTLGNSTLTLGGTTSSVGNLTVTNTTVTEMKETATVSATAATGTVNFDVLTQVVLYYTTNASGNWTTNFRGNSGTTLDSVMATGQSLSATFLVTQGSTAYYNSAVTIDGNSVTPKWQGGSAPTSGNASSVDSYTYVIVKTGSATFTVFASQTKFA